MSGPDYSDYAFFSDTQYLVGYAILYVACVLSIAGSSVILYLIRKTKRLDDLYHRLLFGLSCTDLILSISLFWQPLFLPQATGYPLAIGNAATCRTVGFGYLFFVGSYAYNCLLGLYFVSIVRYRIKTDQIANLMEPTGHIVAFGMPVVIGSLALAYNLLNPNPFFGACTLFPSQDDCLWKSSVTCENARAEQALGLLLDIYALTLAVVGLVSTILAYLSSRAQYQAFQRLQQRPQESVQQQQQQQMGTVHNEASSVSPNNNNNTHASSSIVIHERHVKQMRAIVQQAIWYAAAYLLGLVMVLVANGLQTYHVGNLHDTQDLTVLSSETGYYISIILAWALFSLQGLLNAIIFVRPKMARWKDAHPELDWIMAFRLVLTGDKPPAFGESTSYNPNSSNNNNNHANANHGGLGPLVPSETAVSEGGDLAVVVSMETDHTVPALQQGGGSD